jgi:phospholipase/lecithinase/hemolysin
MTGTVVGAQTESAALQGVINNRFAPGLLALTAATIASVAMMSQASAQSFNQVIVFGDSTVDSGFTKWWGIRAVAPVSILLLQPPLRLAERARRPVGEG